MSASSLLRPGPLAFRRSDGELPRTSFDVKPPRRLARAGWHLSTDAALLAGACLLLAALAGTMGVVSWHAQFAYVYAVKHEHLASVLEALGLDAGAVIFSVLGVVLARLGRRAGIERVLVLACALGSCLMNLLGADLGSPRSVVVYVMPPLLFAAGSDRLIAVIRRAALGKRDDEDAQRSAWRGIGLAALYVLRFAVAAPSTWQGARQALLAATPPPRTQETLAEAARQHAADVERTRAEAEERVTAAEASRAAAVEQARQDIEAVQREGEERVTRAEQQAAIETARTRAEADSLITAAAAERDQARQLAARDQDTRRQAEQQATRAAAAEAAAREEAGRVRADSAQALAQARADAERERDELRAGAEARITAIEEARGDLRARAERAELSQMRATAGGRVQPPVIPASRSPRPPGGSKQSRLLDLAAKRHDLAAVPLAEVSAIATALAPEANLHPGTARRVLLSHVRDLQGGSAA